MAYKLEKPYNNEQYADFVVKHNHNNGREIVETLTAVFALESNEIMGEYGEPIKDPDYELKMAELAKTDRIEEIKSQLDELDLKTIRALREGGQTKDGKPYLEVYQEEIDKLRAELQAL